MNSDLEVYLEQNNVDTEIDDFLEHFGIRGQRWGVRNKRAQVGDFRKSNRVKSINKAFQRHPMATRLGFAGASAGIAVGVGLLMNKFKTKKVSDLNSHNGLTSSQYQELIKEFANLKTG